jgi:hypothetical protein
MSDASRFRPALLSGSILAAAGLLTPVAPLAAEASQPATPPAAAGSGLGVQPWSQRAVTATVAGRQVTSDLGPGRTERWIGLAVAGEELVNSLFGAGDLLPRVLPPQSLLLFADPAEYQQVLSGRFGEAATGQTPASSFLFDHQRITAATLPPATEGRDRSPAEADAAAIAADLLATAAVAALDRSFENDLAPALVAALRRFAAETVVLDDGVHPGHPRPETLLAAQVVVRDKAPDLPAILSLDARQWAELDDAAREDATLAVWSLLQFASQREGRPAAQLLRGLAEAVNAGDRPATAVERVGDRGGWPRVLRPWRQWIESATPDPTADILVRVEALAAGLADLAEAGIVPGSLEEAVSQLAARGFSWRAIRQGLPVEIAITDASIVAFEEDPGTGRRPEIELLRPRTTRPGQAAIPPGIEVRSVRLGRLSVSWDRRDTELVRRLTVR